MSYSPNGSGFFHHAVKQASARIDLRLDHLQIEGIGLSLHGQFPAFQTRAICVICGEKRGIYASPKTEAFWTAHWIEA
jgi:hypothetical protein